MTADWQKLVRELELEHPGLHAELVSGAKDCLGTDARLREFERRAKELLTMHQSLVGSR
jgi:hypothetical protein